MEKVKGILESLEKEHGIKVILAVEAGSRAWGLESDDSDYDIRFVYVYEDLRKYVSLKTLRETIDGFSEDRLYDWQGWDITKALKHLSQMNPSITEWLYSPIVYSKQDFNGIDFHSTAKQLLISQKRITPLLHHYRSMAKSNFKTHIQNKTQVKIKKYMYVIRPAGMFQWLLLNQDNWSANFDIDFIKILPSLKESMGVDCYENIIKVIEKKKQINELDEEPRIESIDKWIDYILNQTDDKIKEHETNGKNQEKPDLDDYDQVLHRLLKLTF